ncbi:MAG: 2TM domain-containing protein [Myxococcales bacterium]|nr:2TM domain-containing protein [Myxococcales bacterium]
MPDYSREQAEEILRRALEREQTDGVSHEDLVAAAAEVGIDTAQLERAASELADERQQAEREVQVRAELKRGFFQDLGNTLGFNALMLGIDLLTGPGWWVQWVALFSVLHLGGRAARAFAPNEETLRRTERRLEKREHKRRKRERKREWARDERKRRSNAEAQFERVVEEGVEALLRSAGDRLERYNRDQDGPHVRVEDPDAEEARRDDRGERRSERARRR